GLVQLRLTPPQVGRTPVEMRNQPLCVARVGRGGKLVQQAEKLRPRNVRSGTLLLIELQWLYLVHHVCLATPSMLACFAKTDIWPALLGKIEVDAGRRDVHETVAVIQRQVSVRLLPGFGGRLFVPGLHPACCRDADRCYFVIYFVL